LPPKLLFSVLLYFSEFYQNKVNLFIQNESPSDKYLLALLRKVQGSKFKVEWRAGTHALPGFHGFESLRLMSDCLEKFRVQGSMFKVEWLAGRPPYRVFHDFEKVAGS
jgi:hypothetical protein